MPKLGEMRLKGLIAVIDTAPRTGDARSGFEVRVAELAARNVTARGVVLSLGETPSLASDRATSHPATAPATRPSPPRSALPFRLSAQAIDVNEAKMRASIPQLDLVGDAWFGSGFVPAVAAIVSVSHAAIAFPDLSIQIGDANVTLPISLNAGETSPGEMRFDDITWAGQKFDAVTGTIGHIDGETKLAA